MHLFLFAFSGALAFGIQSASIAQEPLPASSGRSEAIQDHFDCLVEQTKRLDDGISDAATIGAAVASACQTTLSGVVEAESQGKSRQYRRMFAEELASGAESEATRIVLTVRQKQTRREAPEQQQHTEPKSRILDIDDGLSFVKVCRESSIRCSEFAETVIYSFSSGVSFAGQSPALCLPESYRRFELYSDMLELENEGKDLLDAPAIDAILTFLMRRYPCV